MTAALLFFRANWRWALPTLALIGMAVALMLTRATLSARTAQRDAERAAHAQTVANYRTAYAETVRRHTAEAQATEARYAKQKEESDHALVVARDDAQRRLADWMRTQTAERVRASGAGNLSFPADATKGADGPDPGSAVVSAQVLKDLTDNTVRLQEAQKWALSLTSSQEPR